MIITICSNKTINNLFILIQLNKLQELNLFNKIHTKIFFLKITVNIQEIIK